MPTSEEIRQETAERARLRNEGQIAQNRLTATTAIAALLSRLNQLAHQIVNNREQLDLTDARQSNWVSQHPEFSESKFSPSVLMSTSLALLAVYPAVYLIDLLLLSGNARHLAKDFANNIPVLIYTTVFLLPIAVLLFESGFQTQFSVAETRIQKLKWGIASAVMCLVVPAVIVGFSMATTVVKDGTHTADVQKWQLYGKAALAFFAHFIVLLGGKRLHEAKSYLIFKIKNKQLERESSRLTRQIRTDEPALTDTFTDYFKQWNVFNASNAASQIIHDPFDEVTRNEINRSFGYEIIKVRSAQNTPPNNVTNVGEVNGGGTVINPPPDEPPQSSQNQNSQLDDKDLAFDRDGEDEVRP